MELVPDLIGRFALRRAPTRFPQCHGRRGKKEKKKRVTGFRKRGGGFYLPRPLGNEENRREDWEGRKSTSFSLRIYFTYRERERKGEKSLGVEARCLFFCSSSITRGYRGGSKNLSKKNGRSLGREDGLSLASGLLFVICVYFYRSLICRMQLTVKQCRVAKRTTTQETRSLASVYLPQISLSLRYNYWRMRVADLIN